MPPAGPEFFLRGRHYSAIILRMFKPAVLVASLLLCAACAATPPPCPYQGTPDHAPSAGCLVVSQGRLLLVENGQRKVSVPGGKSRPGESAQCAAHRETWEETGLDLVPGALMHVFDTGFHLYRCEPRNGLGPLAPANPMEITRIWWERPAAFDSVNWRYPGQQSVYRELMHELPAQYSTH
jgi:8-oxo-dGTP pyrophosphatase MutT (NUDIX family)